MLRFTNGPYISPIKLLKKNISVSSKKNQKEKQLHKLKVLIFKLLNDNYLFKVLRMKYYNRVVAELAIEGMLKIQSVFVNKLY